METVVTERHVYPFLMDLESTNFTLLNNEEIESARYY